MSSARILVVDDDRDFAESLGEVLTLLGHQVEVRFTGEAAIEAVDENVFDAVLMDIGLPGLSGVECVARIRRIGSGARCFLLTGYSAAHVARQGVAVGADEVLTKPVDLEELSRRLQQINNR